MGWVGTPTSGFVQLDDHSIYQHRDSIKDVKVDHRIYFWFKKDNKLIRLIDRLESYRFFHSALLEYHSDWQVIIASNLSSRVHKRWLTTKNIILSRMFSWWFNQKMIISDCSKTSIDEVIFLKFSMYNYHLRKINNRDNFDWQQDQIYSLCQQIMRYNSVYYRIYVALRSDYVWRLINYSYYIKNAQVSDNIEFRHID
jgi:hypothetical protein